MKFISRILISAAISSIGTVQSLSAQTGDSLKEERFSLHLQATVINQWKPAFDVPYSGDNSLRPEKESVTSLTSTFYMGARLWKGASIFLNPEIAGGSGLSEALGVSDATNGETFRVGDPAPKVYLARLYFNQVFALGSSRSFQESDLNQLALHMPDTYFSVTVGKIGVADYFDDNKFSHDPRTQFMSWSLMSNGAWDYPANTRGYTPSAVLEYVTPTDELRYDFSLMPKLANGNDMNWMAFRSNSQSLEYTHRYKCHSNEGAVRLLAFLTTTNMGNYNQSLLLSPENPEIETTRMNGHTKYGFTLNIEQDLTKDLGAFFRAGWNDGKNETWAFTEIDNSVSAGLVMKGSQWKRENDHVGLAFVSSGLSQPHQDYLTAGGKGFILGDGKLNYSRENLGEFYYSAELKPNSIYLSGAYQLLMNPGFNMDRKGVVQVFSVRLHAEI